MVSVGAKYGSGGRRPGLRRYSACGLRAVATSNEWIHREDRTGGAVLRAHVAQRRPVRQRDVCHSRPVKLDELADHPGAAQELGDGEHQIGRGGPFPELAGEFDTEHLGYEHAHRLAEHRGLSFDTTDAPAQDTEPVD